MKTTTRKISLVKLAIVALAMPQLLLPAAQTGNPPGCGTPNGRTDPPCLPCDAACAYTGVNSFHTSTGNVHRAVTDLAVWGGVGGHQLNFSRHAMSRLNNGLKWFGQGHGWRHSYQWELTSGGTNILDLYYPDGTVRRFTFSNNVWNRAANCTDRLTQSGVDYSLLTKEGFTYHFRKFGSGATAYYLMLDFTDTMGNIYTLTYDGANRLAQVTEPAGRWLRIGYAGTSLNADTFSTLAKINVNPVAGWSEMTVTDTNTYRYLRYYTVCVRRSAS